MIPLIVLLSASLCRSSPIITREPSAVELQRDVVTDIASLKLPPTAGPPNFLRLLGKGPVQTGSLVTRKFPSVGALKSVKPVKEVRGRVVGGPFGLAEAVRVAGRAVIKRIFPRMTLPGEIYSPRPLKVRSPRRRRSYSSLLLGNLAAQYEAKSDIDKGFLATHDVDEVKGAVLARDGDIGRAASVPSPMRVLRGLDSLPRIVQGKILAGDTEGVRVINRLPQKFAKAPFKAKERKRRSSKNTRKDDLMVGGLMENFDTEQEAEEALDQMGISSNDVIKAQGASL